MKSLFILLILIISRSTFATDADIKSSRVGIVDDTFALLIPTAEITEEKPSCATSDILVWDKTTEHGKLLFSLVLSAHMANKTILVGYNATSCSSNGRLLLTRAHSYQ